MVKKKFDIKKWLFFGGIPTCIASVVGFIILSSKTVTSYAELPEKVEKIESYVEQQKRANEIQQKANELLQKIVTKSETTEEEVIVSKDGKMFWNHKDKEWQPIKK